LSTIRKLASQTILYGFTYFAGRLLSFFLVPFYTRIFAPSVYGTISLIYAWIPFLTVVFTYGMETGYFYFANKEKNEGKVEGTTFLSLFYTSLLLSVLMILTSSGIAGLFHGRLRTDYVIYAALILAFDTISVLPFAWLRKHDRSLRFAVLKTANIVINIFFNFLFLIILPYVFAHSGTGIFHDLMAMHYDPAEGVKFVLWANVLSSFIILLLLIPELKKIKFQWSREIWNRMLTYSWPMLIMGFAGVINETFDRQLLSSRLPGTNNQIMAQIGIYSACYKISIFMTLAVQSFRYAAEPFFFRQMRESNSRNMYATVLKYFSFVTSLIFLGVLFYLPIIMQIIGKNFRSGEDVVPILLLANLFLGLFLYLSQWYKQTEKILYGAFVSIGGAIITLIINYIFIPHYGYMASAWATLAAYGSMAIASYILGQRHFPVNYDIAKIGFYIWFSLVLYIVSRLALDNMFGGWTIGAYFLNTLLAGMYVLAFVYIERPGFMARVPVVNKFKRFNQRNDQ
jgi:O-antigen/teichoic acid export membrane protein